MLGLMIGKLVYQWCNDDCVSVNDDLNYLFFVYQLCYDVDAVHDEDALSL